MNILVINAGSSSLKYQLIDIDNKNVLAKGNCERIGIDGKFKHKTFDGRKIRKEMTLNDHKTSVPDSYIGDYRGRCRSYRKRKGN
jgi:acetate kinase (EC 2.7.2.1)